MRHWMPPCHLRSAPLCPTGRQHNSSAGYPVSAATGKASWNRPHWCWMRLHLVPQSAPMQKILRFWSPSCPASWLSFSASGHSGSWQYRGWSRRLFRPRSEPAHRRFHPRTGQLPGAPQSGRHGRRTFHASAPCSTGSTRPGSVPPCQTADAVPFPQLYLHQFSAFSFWAPSALPWLFSGENGSFLRTFPL